MRRLVFDQSSPVHPVSESRGGSLSVTYIGVVVVVAGLYFSFLIWDVRELWTLALCYSSHQDLIPRTVYTVAVPIDPFPYSMRHSGSALFDNKVSDYQNNCQLSGQMCCITPPLFEHPQHCCLVSLQLTHRIYQ